MNAEITSVCMSPFCHSQEFSFCAAAFTISGNFLLNPSANSRLSATRASPPDNSAR